MPEARSSTSRPCFLFREGFECHRTPDGPDLRGGKLGRRHRRSDSNATVSRTAGLAKHGRVPNRLQNFLLHSDTCAQQPQNGPPMDPDPSNPFSPLGLRDQFLVFLIGALGTRRGEVGALRWMDCDFRNEVFYIRHSYYWRRGGHLKATKTEASAKPLPMHPALKSALLEWKAQSLYGAEMDFVFPSLRRNGRKPLDLAAVLNRKIKPAFARLGIAGVGWHTFRHSV